MNVQVSVDGEAFLVDVDRGRVVVNGERVEVETPPRERPFDWIAVDGDRYELVLDEELRHVSVSNDLHHLEVRDACERVTRPLSRDGRVKAPIPGLVRRVPVAPGETVAAGQTLLVLEAMKMQNAITAPLSGRVASLHAREGQGVALGELLAEIAPA